MTAVFGGPPSGLDCARSTEDTKSRPNRWSVSDMNDLQKKRTLTMSLPLKSGPLGRRCSCFAIVKHKRGLEPKWLRMKTLLGNASLS